MLTRKDSSQNIQLLMVYGNELTWLILSNLSLMNLGSPNNTHFELYRDIFKVLVHNERNKRFIRELVFITPEEGARKVNRNFGAAVVELVNKHDLRVRIADI